MCATLAAEVPELICPMNSSINLGLLPAAATRVGVENWLLWQINGSLLVA